jgi:4a-hydroxytetrahydrobiopterin dehydratase
MTTDLVEKVCTPCQGGIAPLGADEGSAIERTYRFGNFREALAFVDRIGALAESEGHHPDISFGWGYAKVSLQTKKIKGLHENDFIMAAKIDRAASA